MDSGNEEEQRVVIEPLQVIYCGICTIPSEYCEYGSCRDKCKKWLLKEHPEEFARLYPSETKPASGVPTEDGVVPTEAMANLTVEGGEGDNEEKKHQSRGGKALKRDVSTMAEKEAAKRAKSKILIHISERNRRKAITYIKGFELFGLDLKKVAKRLAGKYACGCSVVKMPAGNEEVALQGDFIDDLVEFIPKEYTEIKSSQIEVIIKFGAVALFCVLGKTLVRNGMLSSHSLKQLQQLSISCGISSAGPKSSIIERLRNQHEKLTEISKVISIDIGTRNLAFCEMTQDSRVHRLRLVDLDLPVPFDPTTFVAQIRKFADNELALPCGIYLIERQRCRTMGSRAIPESILRVNFVEILLHSLLHGRAFAVSPERVATYYGLPRGKSKKAGSVELVKRMLDESKLSTDVELAKQYHESKKQDDLSDCILQAKAFFEWQRNCGKIFTNFSENLRIATK